MLAVCMLAGLVPQASAHVSPEHIVVANALGQAVDVFVPGPTGADTDQTVRLSRSSSEVDEDGIGIGQQQARGSAVPVFVEQNPGPNTFTVADSATAFPGPTTSDAGGAVNASVGPVSTGVLTSESTADGTPKAHNDATAASATVSSPPRILEVSTLDGTADAGEEPDGTTAAATGFGRVAFARLVLDFTTIEVKVAEATASASADGVTGSAAASCTVAKVVITTPALTLEPAPCNGTSIGPVAIGSNTLEIVLGGSTTSQSPHASSAAVVAVDVLVNSTSILRLGIAEADARLEDPKRELECLDPLPRLTSSGSANGTVVNAVDPGDVQADVGRADAEIDEAGLALSELSAKADAWNARAEQLSVPVLVEAVHSHAEAPPDQADADSVPGPVAAGPVELRAPSAEVSASTEAPASLFGPHAKADQETAFAGLAASSSLDIKSTTVTSHASSDRNPLDVTSTGSALAEYAKVVLGTNTIEVTLVDVSATATANGVPGGATQGTTYEVATVAVNGMDILMGQGTPPPGTVRDLGIVKFTFGVISGSAQPDGTAAESSVDAVVIDVSPSLGGQRVILGHADAKAAFPVAVMIDVDIDEHLDVPPTFGDDGAVLAPHQKFCKAIRFTNNTSQTLTNVVIEDQLNPNLRLVALPPGLKAAGQLVFSDPPMTLVAGQTGSFTFIAEVRAGTPLGTVIQNTATLKSAELAPVTAVPVTFTVGIDSTQPALSVVKNGTRTFDSATRILTAGYKVVNAKGAGLARDVVLDQIDANKGVTRISPAIPLAVGDIAPGGSVAFVVKWQVPAGVSSFVAHFREVGFDANHEHRYAFDSHDDAHTPQGKKRA